MKTYKIKGMTCGGCVSSVTKALETVLPGVKIAVTLDAGEVRVEGDHDSALVEKTIEDAGFDFAGVD